MIRDAEERDVQQLLDIYNPYIEHTTITAEVVPLTYDQFRDRIALYQGVAPWLVFEEDGVAIGYAYAYYHRQRAAYGFSVETSIYVSKAARGKKVATALYEELFRRLYAMGYVNAYAVIVMPNEPSERFHKSMGFVEQAYFPKVMYKHGTWGDVKFLFRAIRDTSEAPQKRVLSK